MKVLNLDGLRPIWLWDENLEEQALAQLRNLAKLPFIHHHGVASMVDGHWGNGTAVGSVIATSGAIIPAAVGVDIGCGMNALRLDLKASDLPDSLASLRHSIERGVPVGFNEHKEAQYEKGVDRMGLGLIVDHHFNMDHKLIDKAYKQIGTLGGGNHFIEVCLDENQDVWVMLHSGSRGIGNKIGQHFIEKAKRLMEQFYITLPDADLAYLPENTNDFKDYIRAVEWAQNYAYANRAAMMKETIKNIRHELKRDVKITAEAINCHHNYISQEHHFGKNVYLTRKGAIRAREGDLGIIPGSMGAKSFIVRGRGNPDSYHSCSHGAGRKMGRKEAGRRFTVEDLKEQTMGVECRKDAGVIDEIPGAYKDIDTVMAAQSDLVDVVHTLKQILNVKG